MQHVRKTFQLERIVAMAWQLLINGLCWGLSWVDILSVNFWAIVKNFGKTGGVLLSSLIRLKVISEIWDIFLRNDLAMD
jgi:hypothetical protein